MPSGISVPVLLQSLNGMEWEGKVVKFDLLVRCVSQDRRQRHDVAEVCLHLVHLQRLVLEGLGWPGTCS